MSSVQVHRRGYALGAEITGIDYSKPLSQETIETIRQAWLDHVVVYLRGADLGPGPFRDFCSQLGELDLENIKTVPQHPDFFEIMIRSNRAVNIDQKAEVRRSNAANYWHADFSSDLAPSTITFLLAKELPAIGGDTLFTNTELAYETLSPAFQRMIEPLEAVHDVKRMPGVKRTKPPIVHSVVRTHAQTGRKALYLGQRVDRFIGMTEEETAPLRDFLMQHATRYEFMYRHRWAVNDLVMWDNRMALHYAVQDYGPEPRTFLRCSLASERTGRPYIEDDASSEQLSAPVG